jgi:hypothetical protein
MGVARDELDTNFEDLRLRSELDARTWWLQPNSASTQLLAATPRFGMS